MHLELRVSIVSDHAKKELAAKNRSNGGVSQDGAAHAALCMLLTRLIRTIGSALWLH